MVQHAVSLLLTGAIHFHHVAPILSKLHWLLIVFQAQLKMLALTYKALYVFLQGQGTSWSSDGRTCERIIFITPPQFWNAFPREVHLAIALRYYRGLIKTFFSGGLLILRIDFSLFLSWFCGCIMHCFSKLRLGCSSGCRKVAYIGFCK